MGDMKAVDMMIYDGLTCSFNDVHMGTYGNHTATKYELSRKAQDEWAYRSHRRAIEAIETGKFSEEIVPVEVPQRRGEALVVSEDERSEEHTSELQSRGHLVCR